MPRPAPIVVGLVTAVLAAGVVAWVVRPERTQRVAPPAHTHHAAVRLHPVLHHVLPLRAPEPAHMGMLPPAAERGLAHRLRQYPAVFLATPAQRAAAERLRRDLARRVLPWRDSRAAAAAGFDVDRPHRRPGDDSALWLHAERRSWHSDRHYLDPQRPDTLIYADLPGRPLVLVGAMFSMPRGLAGPTPGGPITRWHWHRVCVSGSERGLKPLAAGGCPMGARLREGSEMLHIWFTRDLRSAYAIHAPERELCAARLLPRDYCAHTHALHGM